MLTIYFETGLKCSNFGYGKAQKLSFHIDYTKCAKRCHLEIFPNPLTPSEEKQYIQQYTEGDLHAKHILIEHNLLVAHVVKKYQYLDEDPKT